MSDDLLVNDRVRSKAGRRTGEVVDFDEDGDPIVRWDDHGDQYSTYASNVERIDPVPLRFEDVRTGDKITVEVGGEGYTKAIVTGVAVAYSPTVIFIGAVTLRRKDEGGWSLDYERGTIATLTAHTPAEPEWHRAKVIKADTPDYGGQYLISIGGTYDWSATAANYNHDELTNVTIIVDEHGQVRA